MTPKCSQLSRSAAFQTEGKLYLILDFLRGADLFTRLSKEVHGVQAVGFCLEFEGQESRGRGVCACKGMCERACTCTHVCVVGGVCKCVWCVCVYVFGVRVYGVWCARVLKMSHESHREETCRARKILRKRTLPKTPVEL